ncbi:MAG: MFS transporter [Lentisphaerae bacterium]|jgi:ACS family hexuronate transporter-like MFS transporter|nr:MFS transporter [Lentisphaerota bacterium]
MMKKTNFRWIICSLLFFATTVNYMDRQVLSLTYKDFIAPVFGWTDNDYGTITGVFSIIYAICNLFAGKFIDRLGTRKGYLWAIFVWSLGACLHAGCGFGNSALSAVGFTGMFGITVSVWLFLACRSVLALGEAGNFPAAIKVTAEYFPKKDRAFATSIFNAGSSVGALAAPLSIPLIAKWCGWEMSFIIIGALGFVWMGFWMWLYKKPSESSRVNEAELAYINQDEAEQSKDSPAAAPEAEGKGVSIFKAFTFRQTWALIFGRLLTDGVWWFFLFWTPGYLSDQFGYKSSDGMGMALIFTLYAIVTFVSIFLCKIPTYMVDRRGMNPYEGRMLSMFIFALFPLLALGAQPLGAYSAWWPAILIGFACAGHQAWSANMYSVVGDMFPKSTIGTLTGIAQFAAGCGSFIINKSSGKLFTFAAEKGDAFAFCGFSGKPAGYMIVFTYCAVAYMVGWCIMKALVPRYKKVEV